MSRLRLVNRLKLGVVKLYLAITKSNYWKAEWDFEAKMYGNALANPGCIRSPLTDPEKQQYVLKMLRLSEKDVLLDVGCAAGPLLKAVSVHVRSSSGIDLSHEMIHIARRNLMGVPNVEVEQGSVSAIPYEDHMFTKVCCYSVLHYLNRDQVEEALRELHRVTQRDALVLVGDIPKADIRKRKNLGFRVQRFHPQDLMSLCDELGFAAEICRETEASFDLLLHRY